MDVDYKARTGLNSRQGYEEMYKESISSPARFWAKQAEGLAWRKKVCIWALGISVAFGKSAASCCKSSCLAYPVALLLLAAVRSGRQAALQSRPLICCIAGWTKPRFVEL